jgi:putative ATPase
MYDETQNVLVCSSTTVKYSNFSERLRPRTIEELLISDSSITKFNAMINSRDVMNMIFYGSHGTGKTTCANLIGNSPGIEMLYFNALLTNRIDEIRRQVERYATSMSLYGNTKIVLLDEFDFLPTSAQVFIRGLIEETIGSCRFILTANGLHNIQEPLQSRCRPFCFDVPFLSLNESIEKLIQTIKSRLKELNSDLDESRLRQIVVMKFPDYRAIANEIEFELL